MKCIFLEKNIEYVKKNPFFLDIYITYLIGLHVVGITCLFRANWLVARRQPAASPIGIQLTGVEMGKPCTPSPRSMKVSSQRIWLVFLTLPRQNCHMTYTQPHYTVCGVLSRT